MFPIGTWEHGRTSHHSQQWICSWGSDILPGVEPWCFWTQDGTSLPSIIFLVADAECCNRYAFPACDSSVTRHGDRLCSFRCSFRGSVIPAQSIRAERRQEVNLVDSLILAKPHTQGRGQSWPGELSSWHLGSSQRELEQKGTAGVLEMCSFFHCSEIFAWRKSSLCEKKKKNNSELLINS